MSSPTAIEASLRLDIEQYKVRLAESRGEAKKWRDQLRDEGRKAAQAVDPVIKAHADAAAKMAATRAINPWTTASAGAVEYKRVLDSMTPAMARAHAMLASRGAGTQALFAPQAANPWTTASAGYKAPERQPQMAFMSRYDNTLELQRQAQQDRQRREMMGRGGFGSGGGAGMRGLSQAAMQAQDIAVQLQMGTRASIVLAQQGSQLLSAFGTGGALAGGVIAIGGAFYTMGQNAQDAFEGITKSAREFSAESGLLIATTDASNLASNLRQVREHLNALSDKQKEVKESFIGNFAARLGSASGLSEGLGTIFGGGFGRTDKQAADLRAAENKKTEEYGRMVDQAMLSSKQQLDIARLIAQGRQEEAEQLERSIRLDQELAKIDAMRIQDWAKDRLKADARARFDLGAEKPRDAARDKEQILNLETQIEDARLRALDPVERFLELGRKEEKLIQDIAKASREAKDAGGQIKVLEMRNELGNVQEQMRQANDAAVQARDRRDTETDSNRQAEERVKLSRETFELETKIAREQAASGLEENAKVQAFRDELNTLQLTAQLQDRLNLGQAEALKMARERVTAERAATESIQAQANAKQRHGELKDLTTQMRVDALRATGRDRAADKVERESRIQNEAQRIQEATGFSAEDSEGLARQHARNQERAQHREALRNWQRGGSVGPMPRREIRSERDGSTRARMSDYDRMGQTGTSFSRLQGRQSAFEQLQAQPSDYEKLQKGQSAWDKLQARAPLADQHAQNAANAQDPAAGQDRATDYKTLVEQILQELKGMGESWRELTGK